MKNVFEVGATVHFLDGTTINIPKDLAPQFKNSLRNGTTLPDALVHFDDMTIMAQSIKYITWSI